MAYFVEAATGFRLGPLTSILLDLTSFLSSGSFCFKDDGSLYPVVTLRCKGGSPEAEPPPGVPFIGIWNSRRAFMSLRSVSSGRVSVTLSLGQGEL